MLTLYAYDEPNDSKALKNNSLEKPVHTAYCNLKHFKFAIQNSQIAIQKTILLCIFFCIAVLLCKIFKQNRSLPLILNNETLAAPALCVCRSRPELKNDLMRKGYTNTDSAMLSK